jgi:hypothetical protein
MDGNKLKQKQLMQATNWPQKSAHADFYLRFTAQESHFSFSSTCYFLEKL